MGNHLDMQKNDDDMLQSWYEYAAEREGSVDSFLRFLRNRTGDSKDALEQQRKKFGATDKEFLRLRGFKLPRKDFFIEDARRIAAACHLANPKEFVNAMLLVYKLNTSQPSGAMNRSYQAALDEIEDLDEPPKDE